ncbi:MAG: M14 family metallopeptidase [Candidatus Paceibacterota bacterium]|jgi:hypothetical protein
MGLLLTKRNAVLTVVVIALFASLLIFSGLFKKAPLPPPPPVVSDNSKPQYAIIGRSVEGRKIETFTYGQGDRRLIFAGGIHGGYEWNSVLLAYTFMDYLSANPDLIPKNMAITIIPSANPDGVYRVTGKDGRFTITDISTNEQTLEAGRFNADKVDLNRNFGCKWQSKSTWRNAIVNAGSKAFSEPETVAIRDFVLRLKQKPLGVIFWHSQAGEVDASECESGILPTTLDIMNAYAEAAGYKPVKSFDNYSITGDAEGWLASIAVPAITVELSTHRDIEWEKNLAGVKALLTYFDKETRR